MAPNNTVKFEREKKVKQLIAFANRLAGYIKDGISPALSDDLKSHILEFPLPTSSAVSTKAEELDTIGTKVWNIAIRYGRDTLQNDTTKTKTTFCLLRTFALLLLDTAHQNTHTAGSKSNIRVLKASLKAARLCLDENLLDLCLKVLERAAAYEENLFRESSAKDETVDTKAIGNRLRAEYYLLRTCLAWKQSRLDIAEHMFKKSSVKDYLTQHDAVESFADLLYEMGHDQLIQGQFESAIKWLERSYDMLEDLEIENMTADMTELRLSIVQSLVRALLNSPGNATRKRAWDLVKYLENEYGDKLVVYLLKLDLLSTEEVPDLDQYQNTIFRMIRSVTLTDANFKTIMHRIHNFRDNNPLMTCRLLDEFLTVRLLPTMGELTQPWVEKTTITRIWVSVKLQGIDGIPEKLAEVFDLILHETSKPFNADATHASQALLWKRIESSFSKELYRDAGLWCRLCIHPLFENSGELNMAKISRKAMLCSIAEQNLSSARETFFRMPDSAKAVPISRYLIYKVALRDGDSNLAQESLDIICQHSSDASILYACILEAQQMSDTKKATCALYRLIDKYGYNIPPGVHLPALLRSTIRLLIPDMCVNGLVDREVSERLCSIFERAVHQAKKLNNAPIPSEVAVFKYSELEWFSKNSYNLAVKYCVELCPKILARFIATSIEFIELLKKNSTTRDDNLILRHMLCTYLATSNFILLAREQDDVKSSLRYYDSARQHAQKARNISTELLAFNDIGPSGKDDLTSKHFQLIQYELEADLKLEKWSEMNELFQECWKYASLERMGMLADLILVAHSHAIRTRLDQKYQTETLGMLQRVINYAWQNSGSSTVQLSHWIRCLFHLSLSLDEKTSIACVEQAITIAENRRGLPTCYPPMELEYLATVVFNKAVDFYCASDDTNCKIWAEKALALAAEAMDDGMLKDLLIKKYAGLTWD